MTFPTVSDIHALKLLRWARALKLLMFILPVLVLFYQYKELSVGDFFLIQGIACFFIFLFEIPTGYIGDLFCRKKVLVFAFIFYFLGFLFWFFFSGFTPILIGEACFSLAIALYSGTSQAYIYDILKRIHREEDLLKETAKIERLSNIATMTGSLSGAAIYATLGPSMTIILEASIVFIALIMVLFLPEVPEAKRKVNEGKSKWKDILEIVHYAYNHPEIKALILFPAAYGSGTFILMWGLQPLMNSATIPVALFGLFMGINQFARVFYAFIAHYVFERFGTMRIAYFLLGFITLGYLSATTFVWIVSTPLIYLSLVIIAVVAASQLLIRLITNTLIQQRVRADERATALSLASMMSRLGSAFMLICAKGFIDGFDLTVMFFSIGIIVVSCVTYALLNLKKKFSNTIKEQAV